MPEEAVLFLILNLSVRNGGPAMRTPVYNSLTSVDEILFIKSYEYFLYGL